MFTYLLRNSKYFYDFHTNSNKFDYFWYLRTYLEKFMYFCDFRINSNKFEYLGFSGGGGVITGKTAVTVASCIDVGERVRLQYRPEWCFKLYIHRLRNYTFEMLATDYLKSWFLYLLIGIHYNVFDIVQNRTIFAIFILV